jgi:hypothetical protein
MMEEGLELNAMTVSRQPDRSVMKMKVAGRSCCQREWLSRFTITSDVSQQFSELLILNR